MFPKKFASLVFTLILLICVLCSVPDFFTLKSIDSFGYRFEESVSGYLHEVRKLAWPFFFSFPM